ncbi:unnamed protein product, partial [Staurois parvus]
HWIVWLDSGHRVIWHQVIWLDSGYRVICIIGPSGWVDTSSWVGYTGSSGMVLVTGAQESSCRQRRADGWNKGGSSCYRGLLYRVKDRISAASGSRGLICGS